MSFNSRDLMIDLTPFAQPAFQACGQATRDQQDGDCGQATRDSDTNEVTRTGVNLALLRQQLRQTLASEARP